MEYVTVDAGGRFIYYSVNKFIYKRYGKIYKNRFYVKCLNEKCEATGSVVNDRLFFAKVSFINMTILYSFVYLRKQQLS